MLLNKKYWRLLVAGKRRVPPSSTQLQGQKGEIKEGFYHIFNSYPNSLTLSKHGPTHTHTPLYTRTVSVDSFMYLLVCENREIVSIGRGIRS